MKNTPRHLSYEIELQPGEKLTLPPALLECVGAGRWIVTVQPANETEQPPRNHAAFLNSYAESDEGLYDADSGW